MKRRECVGAHDEPQLATRVEPREPKRLQRGRRSDAPGVPQWPPAGRVFQHFHGYEARRSGKLVLKVSTGKDKETAEKYLDLAKDVKVLLEDIVTKAKELPEGKLSDLTEGTQVAAQLDAAGKNVVTIQARGPSIHASIKSIELGRNTFVIRTKTADGPDTHRSTGRVHVSDRSLLGR